MSTPTELAVSGTTELTIDSRRVRLTHLERELYPGTGFTKADAIGYYLSIADVLLPHLAERPLTLGRFPMGVAARGFAQTEIKSRPPWIRTLPLALANGTIRNFTLADERATLVWLAQMGVLELHTFLGRADNLARPTAVVLDLDPVEPAGILDCAEVALALRDRLAALRLQCTVKSSGALGLHVLVPLNGPAAFPETRAFAKRLAEELSARLPDRVTLAMARASRTGRVLVDVRQNSERLTMIAPYSLRATPWPLVSTPLAWPEVERAIESGNPGQLRFEVPEVLGRVRELGDLLSPLLTLRQRLPSA